MKEEKVGGKESIGRNEAAKSKSSFLSVGELSAILQVREGTIYQWASDERVPSYKVGGRLRFDWGEIQEWLKEGRDQQKRRKELRKKRRRRNEESEV